MNYGALSSIMLSILTLSGGGPMCHADIGLDDNYIREMVYLAAGDTVNARVSTAYYDGMGRERLTVRGVSDESVPSIALRQDYDEAGNISRRWLPIGISGKFVSPTQYLNSAKDLYYDTIPFSYTDYSEAAKGFPVLSYRPGCVFERHPSKQWKAVCSVDSSSEYRCPRLVVGADDNVSVSGAYEPGTLAVKASLDEDGDTTLVFENRAGKTVMERRIGHRITANTHYVYDCAGDLLYVISPEGSIRLPSSGKVSEEVLRDYSHAYTYDWLHRVATYRLPGSDAIEYVYDKFGNEIFHSDKVQRTNGEWTATLYDSHMRRAVTGTVKIRTDRNTLEALYADSTLCCERDNSSSETGLGYSTYKTLKNFTGLMSWFYDDYTYIDATDPSARPLFEGTSDDDYTACGQCTGMAFNDTNGNVWYRAIRYDGHRNVTRISQWDIFKRADRHTVETDYSFTGEPLTVREILEIFEEGNVVSADTATMSMKYDQMGRLTERRLKVNGGPWLPVNECAYDAIGRISSEKRGTDIEYAYDMWGNLLSISSPYYSQHNRFNDSRTEGDSYTFINSTTENWNLPSAYSITYKFGYGKLGRLLSATSPQGSSENFDVDLDANVTNILRKYKNSIVQDAAIQFEGPKAVAVNDVSTPYYTDAVGQFKAGSYQLAYDRAGRLISDGTRGISQISYHPYGNLPRRITMSNGDEENSTYLADGTLRTRRLKTYRTRAVTRVTAAGDTVIRYLRDDIISTMTRRGSFETVAGPTRSRIYRTPTGHYDLASGKYYWYLTDRLGSTVAVIDTAGVVQRNGYYASGLPFILPCDRQTRISSGTGVLTPETPGLAVSAGIPDAKGIAFTMPTMTPVTDRLHIGNSYIGHSGLGLYDNTARLHDPILCRFHIPDAFASRYYDISPYVHCKSNPVNAVDKDGNVVIFINGMHCTSGGTSEYWEGVDETIMEKLKDESARYYDGSFGGVTTINKNINPYVRMFYGFMMGISQAEEIYDNLVGEESIKIVSHSMGGAYAKGFVLGLQFHACLRGKESRIDMELDLAPYQHFVQKANPFVHTTTISHWNDHIAGPSFMLNADNIRTGFFRFSFHPTKEHSISSFNVEVEKYLSNYIADPSKGGSKRKWEEPCNIYITILKKIIEIFH